MTTPDIAAKQPKTGQRFRLPDPPERELDELMTSSKHLHLPGNSHHLLQHLGNPESTIVGAELYITMMPARRLPSGSYRRVPDLVVAFGVDPAAYYASNGYIVQEQGKPPDFVLEVASPSTADTDTGAKRTDYEALGITEYWRFDETGEHHKTKLAGDRLVNGRYEPIVIEELPGGILQGYSAALNLYIRWENGRLTWHDPATGEHIATFESERARADAESTRADTEREGRIEEREARITESARADAEREARATAEAERNAERQARLAAEARVRELEARLSQQNP